MLSKGFIKGDLITGVKDSLNKRWLGYFKAAVGGCAVIGLCLGLNAISHAAEIKVSQTVKLSQAYTENLNQMMKESP